MLLLSGFFPRVLQNSAGRSMPRFRGGGEADEFKLMEDNADSQPCCSQSVDDKDPEMSDECTSLHSLANLRSALAINIKSSKKVVVEETPAPCSSPSSSSLSAEAWTQVHHNSNNSILNKRKLADKLNILVLAREKSMLMDDSSDEDDAEAASLDTLCFLQTNKRGKCTVSDTTRTSNRAKLKNPLAVKKPR